MTPAELPEPEDVETAVREIVNKHIDVSAASRKFRDDVAGAASVMTIQIQNLLQGTEPEEYPGYDWFSLCDLDYHNGPEYRYERPGLSITGYEDSAVAEDLKEYVKRVNPEVFARIEENNRKEEEIINIRKSRNKISFENHIARLTGNMEICLWKKVDSCMQSPVIPDEWNAEKAQYLYSVIYRFFKRHTLPGKDGEYEARKAAEEYYGEYCMKMHLPFIVLSDFFYDLHAYNGKHIRRYRRNTIYEKCDTYAGRYRTPENAWLWESVDLADDLRRKYRKEGVGVSVKGGAEKMVIPYYFFKPYLALLKYRCGRMQDEAAKHQEVLDFINHQYRGYPGETFLGYPRMYRDICTYAGVTPVNLAEYEEEEKKLVSEHTREIADRE